MNYLVIFDRETGQIEHFISSSRKMPTLADFGIPLEPNWVAKEIVPIEVLGEEGTVKGTKEFGFEVSRDHKVILNPDGDIIATEPSLNPVQPEPPVPPRDLEAEIDDLMRARIESLEERVEKLEKSVLKALRS